MSTMLDKSETSRAHTMDERSLEHRRRTAQRVLPTVERLLLGSTYPELTVDQIAREAGLSRSTFYNYFADKSDLLRALTEDVMGAIVAASRTWWQLPAAATRQDFAAALDALVDAYVPHAELMTAVADQVPHDAAVREAFLSFMTVGTEGIEGYIRLGQASGVLREELDPPSAAHWLTWMLERGLSTLTRAESGYDRDQIRRALVEIVWKALRP